MTAHPLVAELRTLRHILGVRATDIADATGLNLASISHWECGRYVPRLEKFVPYAAAIGFDVVLQPTDETATADQRAALLGLTAAEVDALLTAARSWAALASDEAEEPADGPDPQLLAALDRLAPDADTYDPAYPLDACQPGDPTRPTVAPYSRRRDDTTTVHLPAHDITA